MNQLRHTHESLHTLFAELLSSYQGRLTDSGKSALLEELEARLTGQVMNRTQDMITDALMLANSSRAAVAGAQQRAGLAIITFGGVLVLVVGVTLFLAVRSISRPLAQLSESAPSWRPFSDEVIAVSGGRRLTSCAGRARWH